MKRQLALLALLLVSAQSLAQDGVAKAVVQFDGERWPGTFTQAGTTITVTQDDDDSPLTDTLQPKNIRVGDLVYLDFSSSSLTDRSFEVVALSGSGFTVTAPTSLNTSGSLYIRAHVRHRLNIQAVNYKGTGWYTVHFTTPFQSDRYAAVGGQRYWKTEHDNIFYLTPQSAGHFEVQFFGTGGSRADAEYASFAFFGKLQGEP